MCTMISHPPAFLCCRLFMSSLRHMPSLAWSTKDIRNVDAMCMYWGHGLVTGNLQGFAHSRAVTDCPTCVLQIDAMFYGHEHVSCFQGCLAQMSVMRAAICHTVHAPRHSTIL